MKKYVSRLSVLILVMLCSICLHAQNITISGDGVSPLTLSKSTLQDMKQTVIMAKAHDEKVHRYTGVALSDLLQKAGIILGDSAKHKTITSYVVVTAADSYRAVYALSEIDPLFANRPIILADKMDKKLLPMQDGPFQIIVPGEKKHARWTRQVTNIQVVNLK